MGGNRRPQPKVELEITEEAEELCAQLSLSSCRQVKAHRTHGPHGRGQPRNTRNTRKGIHVISVSSVCSVGEILLIAGRCSPFAVQRNEAAQRGPCVLWALNWIWLRPADAPNSLRFRFCRMSFRVFELLSRRKHSAGFQCPWARDQGARADAGPTISPVIRVHLRSFAALLHAVPCSSAGVRAARTFSKIPENPSGKCAERY
jgi:hypothetical protein